jgi:hypothetical protein
MQIRNRNPIFTFLVSPDFGGAQSGNVGVGSDDGAYTDLGQLKSADRDIEQLAPSMHAIFLSSLGCSWKSFKRSLVRVVCKSRV